MNTKELPNNPVQAGILKLVLCEGVFLLLGGGVILYNSAYLMHGIGVIVGGSIIGAVLFVMGTLNITCPECAEKLSSGSDPNSRTCKRCDILWKFPAR